MQSRILAEQAASLQDSSGVRIDCLSNASADVETLAASATSLSNNAACNAYKSLNLGRGQFCIKHISTHIPVSGAHSW